MSASGLFAKYLELMRKADKQKDALYQEMKEARKKKDLNESGWKELADYEEAKAEYLAQTRVAKIYGQICHDLEAALTS